MPSHTYEFVEGRDDFSEPDKEILSLRAENANLREEVERLIFTLAETEALEMSHGEVIERLMKERDEEIARNRPLHALVSSLEKTKSILIRKSEEGKAAVATLESERQANAMLTEQLTAALAACEFKDKALDELIPLAISDCQQWSSADPETDPYIVQARKVLATQPDASALQAFRNDVINDCITTVEATYQASVEITAALTELKK